MGKKKRRQQEDLWVATSELPRTAGHPFYERLNGLFNEHGFDDFVEGLCAKFYADKMGRPSLAPGVYFRLLLPHSMILSVRRSLARDHVRLYTTDCFHHGLLGS